MARNLPVAFGAILAGGVLLDAAIKGASLGDVVKGQAKATAASSSLTGSTSSTAAGSIPGIGSALGGVPGVGSVLKSLFPGGTKITIQRRDQGRDLEVPAGTDVLAPGNGYLVHNGSDPSGFGDSYPVVHFTTGPWAGEDVYIGHVKSLLTAGEHFVTGQPLGQTQSGKGPYVGNATSPGWTEIGLAAGGIPGAMGQPLPAGL